MNNMTSEILDYCRALKLTYTRDNFEAFAADAARTEQNHLSFLHGLLAGETERRLNNGITRRISDARFPVKRYLADFDRSKYAPEFERKFNELEELDFIANKENIIRPVTKPPNGYF